jgi:dihydrofolate synthase/folylpolyglutamate synthase
MVSSAFLSESELTAYLFNLRRYGIRLGLENIARLLRALGNPQERFASVHIAGTNGKGSTGALLTALLQEAGFRTGLYTSPHLISFRERIQVDGKWIPLTDVVERVQRLRPTIETYHCTFFEVMTALAFDYFAAQNVQVAVVETGLGGRLDATNILKPVLSVITEIDLDHMADLGSTIADIAREKGGIIKTGVPLVTSAHRPEALEVLSGICAEHRSSFHAVARECRFDDV